LHGISSPTTSNPSNVNQSVASRNNGKVTRLLLLKGAKRFSVEVLGRTSLRYREADQQMFIDSEVLTGPSATAVYKDTIQKLNSPYNNASSPIQITVGNRSYTIH